MQLDEIGNGVYFADYEIFHNLAVPYTAICLTPCEILTI